MSDPILQFFEYGHLPEKFQAISRPFCQLAHALCEDSEAFQDCRKLPDNPERSVALRKLLEAKDAAVRAAIFKESV